MADHDPRVIDLNFNGRAGRLSAIFIGGLLIVVLITALLRS
jgi:hypothetical protein